MAIQSDIFDYWFYYQSLLDNKLKEAALFLQRFLINGAKIPYVNSMLMDQSNKLLNISCYYLRSSLNLLYEAFQDFIFKILWKGPEIGLALFWLLITAPNKCLNRCIKRTYSVLLRNYLLFKLSLLLVNKLGDKLLSYNAGVMFCLIWKIEISRGKPKQIHYVHSSISRLDTLNLGRAVIANYVTILVLKLKVFLSKKILWNFLHNFMEFLVPIEAFSIISCSIETLANLIEMEDPLEDGLNDYPLP